MLLNVNAYELDKVSFIYMSKNYIDINIYINNILAYRVYWNINVTEPAINVETLNDQFITSREVMLVGNFFNNLKKYLNKKSIKYNI